MSDPDRPRDGLDDVADAVARAEVWREDVRREAEGQGPDGSGSDGHPDEPPTDDHGVGEAIPEPPEDGVPPHDGTGAAGGGRPPVDPEVLAACAPLDQNDCDNGRRLLNHFGADIVHVREIGWHGWTGRHWDPDGGQEAVERAAQETAKRTRLEAIHIQPTKRERDDMAAAAPFEGKDMADLTEAEKEIVVIGKRANASHSKRRSDRRKFSISCGNRSRTVAMIAQALPHRTVAPPALDSEPWAFNVENGTLRFERTEVLDEECPDPDVKRMRREVAVRLDPHAREDMIAKLAPVAYDPAATCPRWLAFCERYQPDPGNRRFLQTVAGRGMLGGASTQVLVFLFGDGANGKTVWVEVVTRLLGAYAGRLKPESITGLGEQAGDKATPDFARLAGKRMVAISELPRGVPLKEALIKTMTGSDPMPVRHLNKGFFDLVPEFVPIMTGNDEPEVGGLDDGIWRRLKIVPWPVKVPKDEQRPPSEVIAGFLEEAPGILNWLIEGARRFLLEGLEDSASIAETTSAQRADRDPLEAFAKACIRACDHVPGLSGEVQARRMYDAFVAWCHASAVKPWKEAMFGRAMKRKGFVREDGRIRKWIGVELFDVPEMSRSPRGGDGEPGDPGWNPPG
jgi:putative DNA primase/helicase